MAMAMVVAVLVAVVMAVLVTVVGVKAEVVMAVSTDTRSAMYTLRFDSRTWFE